MISNGFILSLRRVTVLLKRIPGAVLLLEPLRRHFSKRAGRFLVRDFDQTLSIKLSLQEHMQSQIFWYGYYSRDIVLLMDRLLRPGMVVFDVGANIGEVSVAAARRVGASGRVYSFEPMGSLYLRLKEHLDMNHLDQVTAIQCGLSDRTGKATIFSAKDPFSDGTVHEGLGTLFSSKDRSVSAGEIAITTLDEFCRLEQVHKIDLLKIDVEGAELAVLNGGKDVLETHRPYIIIEIQNETSRGAGYQAADIIGLMKALGYTLFVIGRKARLRSLDMTKLRSFQNVLAVPPEAGLP